MGRAVALRFAGAGWNVALIGRHFFGEFRELGKVSMTGKAHFGGRPGAVHRVTYSPRSRFVWAAEPKTAVQLTGSRRKPGAGAAPLDSATPTNYNS